MHCRAVLLLDQELHQLQAEPLWGIAIHRVPDNPLLCFANISGLKDSMWEHGTFHVTFHFSEHYNIEAPEVVFNTIPFHPNVHPLSGKMCVDFLDNTMKAKRQEQVSLINILLSIQELISNPALDNAINIDAKQLLVDSPHEYDNMVRQCVTESQRLQEVFNDQLMENISDIYSMKAKPTVETIKQSKNQGMTGAASLKARQVSFDVYHRAWVQCATTKPASRYQETALEEEEKVTLLMWNPDYARVHSVSPGSAITVAPSRLKLPQLNKPADSNPKLSRMRQKKLERISAMKRLYLNRSSDSDDPGTAAPATSMTDVARPLTDTGTATAASEAWEREADELVAWTGTLNEDAM